MILSTATAIYLAGMVLFAAPSAHDPFDGATEVRLFSFDGDEDRDYDGSPDGWIRRKGPEFPKYVNIEIDRDRAYRGTQSLKFDVNGGKAIFYSPLIEIDPLHSYVFRGFVRTQGLQADAAVISLSLLNHKRQRIQRFLSDPVSGTHEGWVDLRLSNIAPHPDVRFAVVGCHLVHNTDMDIRGTVWFDELWLGKLPQLKLVSNSKTHFKDRDTPIEIESHVSGLDPEKTYSLFLEMVHGKDETPLTMEFPLESSEQQPITDDAAAVPRPIVKVWSLPPQEYGFYRVRSKLKREGTVILEKETTFAVMDIVPKEQETDRGEFGWSVAHQPTDLSPEELVEIAAQAGINWLKYPLWQSVYGPNQILPARISEMLEKLVSHKITPVGLLITPPADLRAQFAEDWTGIAEIFGMSPDFWRSSIDPVIARYSSNVRHWQLGNESDSSFVELTELPKTLSIVKREFDRIGRDTLIGLHWGWDAPFPHRSQMRQTFLSVNEYVPAPLDPDRLPNQAVEMRRLSPQEFTERLQNSADSQLPRWALIQPLPKSEFPTEVRAADLVKRIVHARVGGAEATFAYDVFDDERGLLNSNGSPSELFLPWRNIALALRRSQYIDSFEMLEGSTNFAFARNGSIAIVVWNDVEAVEEMYLGEDVSILQLDGRVSKAETIDSPKRQRFKVGPVPIILLNCSEPIIRWRMAIRYKHGALRSASGKQAEALLGVNTFSQTVDGTATLRLPEEWEVEPKVLRLQLPPDKPFEIPLYLTLPINANLGQHETWIEFNISADKPYVFRIFRPYQVGLGDVTIDVVSQKTPDGRLEIEQTIKNSTSPPETLSFQCSLFTPGYRRQKERVFKLESGHASLKKYYLPKADSLMGKELWIRAEQVGGRRILNYRWTVGSEPENKVADGTPVPAAKRAPLPESN